MRDGEIMWFIVFVAVIMLLYFMLAFVILVALNMLGFTIQYNWQSISAVFVIMCIFWLLVNSIRNS
jgi:hypothetical protein